MIRWLIRAAADVPADDGWLGPRERDVLAGLRRENRRADWRLGRFASKRALCAWLAERGRNTAPAAVEILAAPSGAPVAWLCGAALPVTLSIAHRDGVALAGFAPGQVAFGCDLERIEPRSDAFVADWLTDGERALVAGTARVDRPRLTNLIWSAKESALKALTVGLRRDTRSVEVRLGTAAVDGWHRLQVASRPDGVTFDGWWREMHHGESSFVLTVAASVSAAPVDLDGHVDAAGVL